MRQFVKFLSVLYLCILLSLSFVSCNDSVDTSSRRYGSETNKETTTDDGIITGTVISEKSSEISTTGTSEPQFVTNPFEGILEYTDKLIIRRYKAPLTGTYRFDFKLTSNANARFRFTIRDSTDLIIIDEYGINNTNGVTVDLEGGEIYKFYYEQEEGFSSFRMNIGEPNPESVIQGNSISGSIKYKDQNNHYKYTATKTGKYRIECDPSDYTAYYYLSITDSTNAEKYNRLQIGADGNTLNLTADETYNIVITQNEGISYTYVLNIHTPNNIQSIKNQKMTGGFTFIGQQNIYVFSVPKTGKYKFTVETSDVTANFSFIVQNKKKLKLIERISVGDGTEIEAELNAGQTYTAFVEQTNGKCNYTIKFECV